MQENFLLLTPPPSKIKDLSWSPLPYTFLSPAVWLWLIIRHCAMPTAPHFCPQTSDLQLVRDALRSLRNSFSGHDPQHHTIDSLEQGISSLMERLHVMETQKKQERRVILFLWYFS